MKFKVRILLFSLLREKIGTGKLILEVEGPLEVFKLIDNVAFAWPAIKPYQSILRVAVNQEFASGDTLVRPGDEVALIMPVSGG